MAPWVQLPRSRDISESVRLAPRSPDRLHHLNFSKGSVAENLRKSSVKLRAGVGIVIAIGRWDRGPSFTMSGRFDGSGKWTYLRGRSRNPVLEEEAWGISQALIRHGGKRNLQPAVAGESHGYLFWYLLHAIVEK